MKYLQGILLVLLVLGSTWLGACQAGGAQIGLLQGSVSIGPIWPVETPGQTQPVPPEVFSTRKILIYDASGNNLVHEVSIYQIDQTANGYYAVQLETGTYTVDTNTMGIGGAGNLPKQITISPGETVTLNIDIDTGIR